jgi:hypothetical protein
MTDWEKFLEAATRIFGGGGFTTTDEQAEMDSSDTMQFSVARMTPVPPGRRGAELDLAYSAPCERTDRAILNTSRRNHVDHIET